MFVNINPFFPFILMKKLIAKLFVVMLANETSKDVEFYL